ncbi:NPN-dependent 2-hydroxyacid racemase, LarAH10 family [Alkaliphilus crotonatoxidans]
MRQYHFKYGSRQWEVALKEENIINILTPKDSSPIDKIEEKIRERLDRPIGTGPLRELVKAKDKIVIIVSDITRLWIKTAVFLPVIVAYLNELGIEDEDITVIIALGSHRPSTEEEKRAIVGDGIYERIEIIDHNCNDEDQLCYLGESSRGTPIYINKKVVKADRVILTGGIVFHLFAGFGGGAKGIVPGVAGIQTIQQNHRLTFLPGEGTGLNSNACSNKIEGNPMREDITEICRRVAPDFLFNAVLDANGRFIDFAVGDFEQAWLKGCETIRQLYGINIKEKADIIIASAGGYPKDINLYQTVKTMDNCIYGGKENSVMILLSECRDGLGAAEFMEWFQYQTLDEMESALKKHFTVPGYAAYKTAYAAKYRKVILISSLPKDTVKELGMIPAQDLNEALDLAYRFSPPNPKISLMPYGGNTLPIFE